MRLGMPRRWCGCPWRGTAAFGQGAPSFPEIRVAHALAKYPPLWVAGVRGGFGCRLRARLLLLHGEMALFPQIMGGGTLPALPKSCPFLTALWLFRWFPLFGIKRSIIKKPNNNNKKLSGLAGALETPPSGMW